MLDCLNIQVETLLPHSPPMVLLERVLEYDSQGLLAGVAISESSMFYDREINGVPTWVGIEYMAQSISALAGLRAREAGLPVNIGLLLGTRKLKLYRSSFRLGNSYVVKVRQLFWDESGLATFDCSIFQEAEVYVEAVVNVFETESVKRLMER